MGSPSAPLSSASPRAPAQVNRLNSGRRRAQEAGGAPGSRLTAAAATAAELAELLASLKQIQRALKASGAGLQQELAVAQSLLTSPEFQRVLAVHNKVQEIWCFNAPPSALCHNAQDVVQEVSGVRAYRYRLESQGISRGGGRLTNSWAEEGRGASSIPSQCGYISSGHDEYVLVGLMQSCRCDKLCMYHYVCDDAMSY